MNPRLGVSAGRTVTDMTNTNTTDGKTIRVAISRKNRIRGGRNGEKAPASIDNVFVLLPKHGRPMITAGNRITRHFRTRTVDRGGGGGGGKSEPRPIGIDSECRNGYQTAGIRRTGRRPRRRRPPEFIIYNIPCRARTRLSSIDSGGPPVASSSPAVPTPPPPPPKFCAHLVRTQTGRRR